MHCGECQNSCGGEATPDKFSSIVSHYSLYLVH
ncbi:hypothetical protein [Pedobacter sp. Hv1]